MIPRPLPARYARRLRDQKAIESSILDILLSGRASDAASAERFLLDEHVDDVALLALSDISDEEFRRHPLLLLLMMHGSRPYEDSLA